MNQVNLAVINQKEIDINLLFPNNFGLTKIEPKEFNKLKASLQKDEGNSNQPILVRPVGGQYEVIDGVQRCIAMKDLGFEKIWCSIEELSDQEALIRAIQCNKFRGVFDQMELAKLLGYLQDTYEINNRDINDLMGFEPEEMYTLRELLASDEDEDIPDDSEDEEIDIPDIQDDDELEGDEQPKNEPIVLDLTSDEMDMITALTMKSGLPRDKAIFASVAMMREKLAE